MNARSLSLLIGGLFLLAAGTALAFPPRARVYPLGVALAGALLSLGAWIRTPRDETVGGPGILDVTPYLAWIVGLLLASALVGLPAAAVLFSGAFLRLEGKSPFRVAALGAVAAGLGLLAVGAALSLRWPVALFDVTRALGLS
ncbi:MAG: hypothetical protein HKN73_11950 [Gemmatimonadetes bacterium]|nr:hypothetical protein [Gemmatimonadota bacterium]